MSAHSDPALPEDPALPQVGTAVEVVSQHWDGRFHREFSGRLIGNDEWGLWVGIAEGTWMRTHRGGFASAAGVRLFPPDRWWSAWISPHRVYVDITTPPEWTGTTVTMADLDLDVETFGDGPPVLRDEDEFDEHRVLMGYPPAVVDAARTAAAEVLELLRTHSEPFGLVSAHWLAEAARMIVT
jgi:protein associated with RNAse G/E